MRSLRLASRAVGQLVRFHSAARDAINDALHFVADDVSDPSLVVLTEDPASVADLDRGRHPRNRW